MYLFEKELALRSGGPGDWGVAEQEGETQPAEQGA